MELKGSKTETNLNEAFAGESMARNKKDMFRLLIFLKKLLAMKKSMLKYGLSY
jgi:hypothetical protein